MLFPNMNEMNNLVYFQNLMKKKSQLGKLESEFDSLLPQIKQNGIIQEAIEQLNHISFHFINFGIEMLGIGIQINKNNNIINSFDIKERISHTISHLKVMSFNIPNNMTQQSITETASQKSEETNTNNFQNYEIKVESSNNDIEQLITCDGQATIDELIKVFLLKIKRKDLFDDEEKEIYFFYNDKRINTPKIKSKILYEIFEDIKNPLILCQFIKG